MRAHLLFFALLLGGCVDTQVKQRGVARIDGTNTVTTDVTFRTRRFMWPGSIATATIGTNGLAIIGYSSQAAQLAEGIAKGVAAGLKP